jgi:aminodeoxyfutalosine synthase
MTAQQMLDTTDLIAAGIAGDDIRRELHGATTTFVRVFEVHVDAVPHALPPRTQAGEFRVVGQPPSLEAAVAAVRAAATLAGAVPVTGFSVDVLLTLGPLDVVARALQNAGLAAVAHLPIDVVDDAAAGSRIREAGLPINTITVHALTDDTRLELCERAARLQDAVGGFQAFAPLPRVTPVAMPTTGYDDVKQIAMARVVARNIRSIQVDWGLYGPKMAQVALTVGADDVDNVSAVDPGILGTRRSPLEEIRTNIKAAGLEAVERDGAFNRL